MQLQFYFNICTESVSDLVLFFSAVRLAVANKIKEKDRDLEIVRDEIKKPLNEFDSSSRA